MAAPMFPLIECHAATRERWSLNSVTKPSKRRVQRRLPGFELMFKAEGKQVERKLQEFVCCQWIAIHRNRGNWVERVLQ